VSELVVTLLRLSYLVLLWVLVLAAVGVLRRDVFGTRIVQRGRKASTAAKPATGRAAVVAQPGPPPQPRAATPTPTPTAKPAGGVPARSSVGAGVAVAPPAAPVPAAAPPAQLQVTDGPLRGTSIPLGTSAVVLGRSPSCTVPLQDDYSSSRHARVYPHEGAWWVEDLGSTNGTFVDGERIDAPTVLTPGKAVRIGQTVLELQR
jgi:FHA domain